MKIFKFDLFNLVLALFVSLNIIACSKSSDNNKGDDSNPAAPTGGTGVSSEELKQYFSNYPKVSGKIYGGWIVPIVNKESDQIQIDSVGMFASNKIAVLTTCRMKKTGDSVSVFIETNAAVTETSFEVLEAKSKVVENPTNKIKCQTSISAQKINYKILNEELFLGKDTLGLKRAY